MITNHKNENNTPSLQKIYYSRQSNMELLRIVSMLLIVLSHCVYHGVYRAGKPETYSFWSSASLAYKASTSFSIMGAIGVGLFFMISGFFNAHKERVSLKRVTPIMRELIWIHWLQPYKYYGKPVFYLHVALCVSVVFGVGLLVDLLREKTLEKPIEGIADRIILLVRHKGFKAD